MIGLQVMNIHDQPFTLEFLNISYLLNLHFFSQCDLSSVVCVSIIRELSICTSDASATDDATVS